MEKVLSSHVGLKINEWYYHIQRFNVPDAEAYKEEIKSMLDHMEENQDLLLYFSLMEFRHKLMLDYLNPLENGKEGQLQGTRNEDQKGPREINRTARVLLQFFLRHV